MAAETSEFLTKCILVGELVMCIPTHVLKGFKPLSHHTLKGMLLHNDFGSSGCRLYEDISEPITPLFQDSSSNYPRVHYDKLYTEDAFIKNTKKLVFF